jgi:acetyl-CoA acetyltransferase
VTNKVVVAGVGMTPFAKPGMSDTYDVLGATAIRMALQDAGVSYDKVQQVYAGYVYGDSTSGQRSCYQVGMTGVPVVNVNNNCATGSTALFLARQAIESGAVDCALAFGFEQMAPGALVEHWQDRPGPLDRFQEVIENAVGKSDIPMALKIFGGAGQAHMDKYGTKPETFAMVRAKASRHAVHNERAIFRSELSVEDVLQSPSVYLMLTRLQCCPPTCGGGAAILCSEKFAKEHDLDSSIVIGAQGVTTDMADVFEDNDPLKVVGTPMTVTASQQVYEKSGIDPKDIDVVELHDCFTPNEVLTYEGLGLCGEGEAEKFIMDGQNTYGGQVVTNPSGGLLSKGHPLGATGLAQCFELVEQLRGNCGARQVEGARNALAHNVGLGGCAVVTLYQKQ